MNVTRKVLWIAVNLIYRNREVRPGSALSLKELMNDWVRFDLRQSDLGDALDSLSSESFIQLENSPEGPIARLLDDRFGRLEATPEDRQAMASLQQLQDRRKRRVAARVGVSAASSEDTRRSSDRATSLA